jgi:hypothetical protein
MPPDPQGTGGERKGREGRGRGDKGKEENGGREGRERRGGDTGREGRDWAPQCLTQIDAPAAVPPAKSECPLANVNRLQKIWLAKCQCLCKDDGT